MILHRVTITGADNDVDPEMLLQITEKYPFVEWGILLSSSQHATPRYPDLCWLSRLVEFAGKHDGLALSAHYCGALCKRFLSETGRLYTIEDWLGGPPLQAVFARVQLNGFHRDSWTSYVQVNALASNMDLRGTDIILQIADDDAHEVAQRVKMRNVHHLYDPSRGEGIQSIQSWEPPKTAYYCGYAGGINPENVRQVLQHLCAFSEDRPFWIDIETGARQDNQLSRTRVESILRIAAEFVS